MGCASRLIGEGMGAVTGASGKVVNMSAPGRLATYKGLRIETIKMVPGLKAPRELQTLLLEEFTKAAAKAGLTPSGTPGLVLAAEVVNYESASAADTAIGPLEEIIIRAQLTDSQSKEVLASANLIGRAKSVTAGGPKHLSEGAAKALSKWLKEGGLRAEEEGESK
jgi:hypothetical protein